eukprot:m51a1_g5563 hypothetical protein (318) ;mRNA; f:582396-583349
MSLGRSSDGLLEEAEPGTEEFSLLEGYDDDGTDDADGADNVGDGDAADDVDDADSAEDAKGADDVDDADGTDDANGADDVDDADGADGVDDADGADAEDYNTSDSNGIGVESNHTANREDGGDRNADSGSGDSSEGGGDDGDSDDDGNNGDMQGSDDRSGDGDDDGDETPHGDEAGPPGPPTAAKLTAQVAAPSRVGEPHERTIAAGLLPELEESLTARDHPPAAAGRAADDQEGLTGEEMKSLAVLLEKREPSADERQLGHVLGLLRDVTPQDRAVILGLFRLASLGRQSIRAVDKHIALDRIFSTLLLQRKSDGL